MEARPHVEWARGRCRLRGVRPARHSGRAGAGNRLQRAARQRWPTRGTDGPGARPLLRRLATRAASGVHGGGCHLMKVPVLRRRHLARAPRRWQRPFRRRRLEWGCSAMPSDRAHRLLALLQAGHEKLCTRCAGAALSLDDRWEVLKAVRELIMMSVVLCRPAERCGMCDRPETLITLRRPRPTIRPRSTETVDRICPRCQSLNVLPIGHITASGAAIRLTYRCLMCLEEFVLRRSLSAST